MPVRKRSRKRPAGRSRKRSMRTRRSKKMSFKQKALRAFPVAKTNNQVFYETTISGQAQTIGAPNLLKGYMINVTRGATMYDGRVANRIFLKGFRIRCHFQNRLLRPAVVHYAIVRPKHSIASQSDSFTTQWFRNLGLGTTSTTQMGTDFLDTQLNGVLYATLPINTDRWDVIQHTRFKLGCISTTGGYSSGELKNYRSLYRYVKINKIIEFPDGNTNFPSIDQQFYQVIWACPFDYSGTTETEIPDALTVLTNVVSVFTRPD